MNADYKTQNVKLPSLNGRQWHRVIDTSLGAGEDFLDFGREVQIDSPSLYIASPRSTVVLLGKTGKK